MSQQGPTDETTLASQATGGVAAGETGASGAKRPPSSSHSHSGWLSSSHPSAGRFASGDVLADRYRIVGLLGRGGMGEVYRADDLRLGQPVALKFLPESVVTDPTRLAQFHNEVRTARQISHRNVCRVYDIGEADGQIFLTMEYVDGEDLAVLLRRIGRFPHDKALEISRQLCAGLAAAHEQGVLHRDLKPANVLLDSDGRVRIADFGLAGVAEDVQDVRAGTPAYMAPEQLAGREVSVRSDIFALGLVLFEVFTGRRVFEAKNVAELLRLHDEGVSFTAVRAAAELDPGVERVIERCLQREPVGRPPSAIAVAAALPGGDPLAAALAAGETPSPEMLVHAGAREALRPAVGLAAVAYIVVGLLVAAVAGNRISLYNQVPFDKPPDVLRDRAQTILASLGYTERAADTASGLSMSEDYLRYGLTSRPGVDRYRELPTGRPATAVFWYRTSPRTLAPPPTEARPDTSGPPMTLTGMTLVMLDTMGRLVEFHAVPPQVESPAPMTAAANVAPAPAPASASANASTTPAPAPASTNAAPASAAPANAASANEPNWAALFAAAQLPMDRFTPADPQWTPRGYADRRAAWTGTLPELGDTPVRVEAAAYRGRPMFFSVLYPWVRASRMVPVMRTPGEMAASFAAAASFFAIMLWAWLVGRRHYRSGRGDLVGARRLAVVGLVILVTSWAVGAKHVADINVELSRFYETVGLSLFFGAVTCLFYLALEPTVRRVWPEGLVGWSRLLAGHWRDPLVGQHILAGVACGVTFCLAVMTARMVGEGIAGSPSPPWSVPVQWMESSRVFASGIISVAFTGLINALFLILLYAFARRFMRRDLYAVPAVVAVFCIAGANSFIMGRHLPTEIAFAILVSTLVVLMMRRFGLLASVVTFFVNTLLFWITPLTTNLSAWYAPMMLWSMALIVGIALYGFVCSRGGEPLFGRALADE